MEPFDGGLTSEETLLPPLKKIPRAAWDQNKYPESFPFSLSFSEYGLISSRWEQECKQARRNIFAILVTQNEFLNYVTFVKRRILGLYNYE